MPDRICVKYEGKTYCWNKETGKIEVFTSDLIPVSKCPECVLVELMKKMSGEKQE